MANMLLQMKAAAKDAGIETSDVALAFAMGFMQAQQTPTSKDVPTLGQSVFDAALMWHHQCAAVGRR